MTPPSVVSWLVEELLPHTEPMILIDGIVSCDGTSLKTFVQISEDSAFCDAFKGVPSWVGVEYMAQSIAALAGIRAKRQNQPVRIGFLVGTRKFSTRTPLFALGECLNVSVSEIFEDNGMGVFDCEIHSTQGETLATARLNVYLPPPSALENTGHK